MPDSDARLLYGPEADVVYVSGSCKAWCPFTLVSDARLPPWEPWEPVASFAPDREPRLPALGVWMLVMPAREPRLPALGTPMLVVPAKEPRLLCASTLVMPAREPRQPSLGASSCVMPAKEPRLPTLGASMFDMPAREPRLPTLGTPVCDVAAREPRLPTWGASMLVIPAKEPRLLGASMFDLPAREPRLPTLGVAIFVMPAREPRLPTCGTSMLAVPASEPRLPALGASTSMLAMPALGASIIVMPASEPRLPTLGTFVLATPDSEPRLSTCGAPMLAIPDSEPRLQVHTLRTPNSCQRKARRLFHTFICCLLIYLVRITCRVRSLPGFLTGTWIGTGALASSAGGRRQSGAWLREWTPTHTLGHFKCHSGGHGILVSKAGLTSLWDIFPTNIFCRSMFFYFFFMDFGTKSNLAKNKSCPQTQQTRGSRVPGKPCVCLGSSVKTNARTQ